MLDHFIDFILKQRVFIIILAVILIITGIYAWQKVDIDAFPDVTNIQVMVLTESPGMAAVDIERQITYPIESQMGGLPSVRYIRSLSKPGLSQVVVIFEDAVNIYFARQIVNERLQLVKENLPEGIVPELGPISTGLGEIYQYTLSSDRKDLPAEARLPKDWFGGQASAQAGQMELRTIQDWLIAPQLRSLQGVNEINSFGGFVKQYHIEVAPEKLTKFGLTLRDVYEAVQQNNANASGNYIVKGWEQGYVRSIGLIAGIQDIENIVLAAEEGTPVFLRDVAEVKLGPETRQGAVTKDGKGETVAGMVIMLKGANSKEVVDRVKAKIPQIQETLSKEGVKLEPFYDRTSLIQSCVKTVTSALLEGGILVIIVLFIFLWQLRAGLIIALSLPISVLIAFILMKWLGMSANLMSLGGLAIALGKVADAGIIVTENIIRHLSEETGESISKFHKIKKALKEVIGPITFAMLIIIIVFAPLFALQDIEGKMFKPLAITNTLVLLAALFTGLVIIPVLCFYFLKQTQETQSFLMRVITKIYQPALLWAMKHRFIVVSSTVVVFLVSLVALSRLGTEFMPQLDEGSIAVNVVRLPSASLDGSKTVAAEIERRVLKFPEVKTIVSKTGRAEISEDPMGPEQNDIFIMLQDKDKWRPGITKKDLVQDISKELAYIPGIRLSFSQPIALRVNELVSGVKSDLAVKIFGDDLDTLRETGVKVSEILSQTRGARDVKLEQISGFSQVNISIDRGSIAQHKINVSDINETIETAVGGKIATWVVEGRMKFAALVRFPYKYRKDIAALQNILIPAPEGYQVPLGHLAEIKEEEGPAQISHENNLRRVVVECNIRERDVGGFVSEIQKRIKDIEKTLPAGYFIEYGGQFENQQRAQKTLMIIVPLAILIIFFLLFMSFGSIRNALLVIFNVPFAMVGGIFALALTGQYLSVPSSVGFIALFGVAMLDGIVLISYIQHHHREKGLSLEDAIVKGALLRMRPILMTAAVAIVGLIPLVSSTGPGAEIQRPLAIVGIGGLVTSTFLTLIVLPTIYPLFHKK
ncbi:MAG: CusA/CzcA family heavy metal efflux RND transporter [Planctomycetota bacterium]